MDVIVIAIIGIAATVSVGVGLFVFDGVYTKPKIVVGSPIVNEIPLSDGTPARMWLVPVTNQRGMLRSIRARDSAHGLNASIMVRPGDRETVCRWGQSENRDASTEPGESITLVEGESNWVYVVIKSQGLLECSVGDGDYTIDLPEGTSILTLTVGRGNSGHYFFLLNNRGTELARLQMKGPMDEAAALQLRANQEIAFPLGGHWIAITHQRSSPRLSNKGGGALYTNGRWFPIGLGPEVFRHLYRSGVGPAELPAGLFQGGV